MQPNACQQQQQRKHLQRTCRLRTSLQRRIRAIIVAYATQSEIEMWEKLTEANTLWIALAFQVPHLIGQSAPRPRRVTRCRPWPKPHPHELTAQPVHLGEQLEQQVFESLCRKIADITRSFTGRMGSPVCGCWHG